jgi:hypothetical protein
MYGCRMRSVPARASAHVVGWSRVLQPDESPAMGDHGAEIARPRAARRRAACEEYRLHPSMSRGPILKREEKFHLYAPKSKNCISCTALMRSSPALLLLTLISEMAGLWQAGLVKRYCGGPISERLGGRRPQPRLLSGRFPAKQTIASLAPVSSSTVRVRASACQADEEWACEGREQSSCQKRS